MFIELVDALRCPYPHEDSWLVASADRMDGRDIVAGTLGCPVCRREFAIADGVADFREAEGGTRHAGRGTWGGARGEPEAHGGGPVLDDGADQAIRLAALLNLVSGRAYAVLCGEWALYASAVRTLSDTHLLLVNPPPGATVGDGTSGVVIDDALPLASGSAGGIALDGSATPGLVGEALRVVEPNGRVVAPIAIAIPDGIRELARDARVWVGERRPTSSGFVGITRARR